MSKRLEQKFVDTNSLVMGSGVGLATLEAMFNMVNTQSLLAAGMVKHHDMSHPLQMQALASALAQILAASEYGDYNDAIPVNLPRRRKGGAAGNTDASAGTNTEMGAVPNLDAIKQLFDEHLGGAGASGGGGGDTTSNLSLDSTTTTGLDGISMDKHLSELLELLRTHLSEIVQNSKQTLAVT